MSDTPAVVMSTFPLPAREPEAEDGLKHFNVTHADLVIHANREDFVGRENENINRCWEMVKANLLLGWMVQQMGGVDRADFRNLTAMTSAFRIAAVLERYYELRLLVGPSGWDITGIEPGSIYTYSHPDKVFGTLAPFVRPGSWVVATSKLDHPRDWWRYDFSGGTVKRTFLPEQNQRLPHYHHNAEARKRYDTAVTTFRPDLGKTGEGAPWAAST